ncbi:MAG: chemotaxis protein CheC [archaeon]
MANIVKELKLSEFDIDIIKELTNIGLGKSSRALGKLINKDILVKITDISLIEKEKILTHVGGEQQIITVFEKISGNISGCLFNLLGEETSRSIVNCLNPQEKNSDKELDSYSIDILKEYSNIIISSYISAISKMVKFRMDLSPPTFFKVNSSEFIEKVFFKNFDESTTYLINIHTVLYADNCEVPLYSDLIVNFNTESINIILSEAKK